jgi:hypothetical protein
MEKIIAASLLIVVVISFILFIKGININSKQYHKNHHQHDHNNQHEQHDQKKCYDYFFDGEKKEGYENTKLSSVTVVGTAKNVGKYLPKTIKKLEMIADLFNEHQIIIYENDSRDNTLDFLKEWKNNSGNKYKIKIISETNIRGKRTHVLSYARNLLLKEALKNNYEYLIVIDLDDVIDDLDEQGILSSFNYNNKIDWAGMGGNQNIYYDIWALRTKDDWLKFDWMECYNETKDYNKCCISRHREINKNDDIIEVDSCFGGVMIYKTKYLKNSFYYGGGGGDDDEDKEVCEHVNLNNLIRMKNNGRIFINPKMITTLNIKIDKVKHIFDEIYSKRKWSKEGNGSGTGSSIRNTMNLRNILTKFLIKNDIHSIVDAPCGSCLWTSTWLNELRKKDMKISYYGFDIANEAVANCKKSMKYLTNFHDVKIEQNNISDIMIPDNVDLLLSRDTLQHLSFENIFKTLKNFAKYNGIKFYMIGGYLENTENVDIRNGDYFNFNISKKPFEIIPDYIIKENNFGNELPKYLFVFNGDNFRKQVNEKLYQ